MKFNVEKLKDDLRTRGLNPAEVSKEIGYNSNYISNSLNSGQIGDPAVKLLKFRYNIGLEEVPKKNQARSGTVAVEVPKKEVIKEFDYNRLQKIIKDAISNSSTQSDDLATALSNLYEESANESETLFRIEKILADIREDSKNFQVQMISYMKKFENHKKYGHF